MNAQAPKMIWVVCDAPAGGCGRGRRKRQLVPANKLYCASCGSQVRVCKKQPATRPCLDCEGTGVLCNYHGTNGPCDCMNDCVCPGCHGKQAFAVSP